MKKRDVKVYLIAVCLLAAGVCCGCGSRREQAGSDFVLVPEEESDVTLPPESESVFVSAESAAEDGEEPEVSQVFYVHICGEVNHPGVYEMREGSRIFQAVELAGGFTERAAESYLNMAQKIADGMKILVPSEDDVREAGLLASGGMSGADADGMRMTGDSEGKVNLNTAGKEALMTLKGIGEARAEDIIRYREENGAFRNIEDVMKVSGIKEAAFEKIKDDITV